MENAVSLWHALTIDISGFKNQINAARCKLIELDCPLDDIILLEDKIKLFEESIKESRERLCLGLLTDSIAESKCILLPPLAEPLIDLPTPELLREVSELLPELVEVVLPVLEVLPEVLPEPTPEVLPEVLPEPTPEPLPEPTEEKPTFTTLSSLSSEQIAELLQFVKSSEIVA